MEKIRLTVPNWVMDQPPSYQADWIEEGYNWIAKMRRYLGTDGWREMAVFRINNPGQLDWDDNISQSWAADAKRQFLDGKR